MDWSLLAPDGSRLLEIIEQNLEYVAYHWWITFSVSALASLVGLILALAAAGAGFYFKTFEVLLRPVVAVSQSFPLQALAPVLLIALGVGFHTKFLIALIIVFFPIYNSALTAFRTVPKQYVALARVCDAAEPLVLAHIRLPAAFPAIVSASRVGFTLAVLGAVVAEFIQPDAGLGHVILVAQSSYNIEMIYVAVTCLMIQGLVVFYGLTAIEKAITTKRGGV